MRPGRPVAALRLVLALVAAVAPLVPRQQREAWRQQWRADLWYQAAASSRSSLDLLLRACGVLPHAVTLRLRHWRNPMLLHDVRYAFRTLIRRPGFTAITVLTLALGVGANATIFSWIDAVVFDPLPAVPRSDRLVALQFVRGEGRELSFSYPNYVDLREADLPEFTGVAVYDLVALNMRIGDEPERVWGQIASANLFEVLQVAAALGRTLQPADDRAPGASPVLVISDGLWRRRFAGDPGVLGRSVTLNGQSFTIVGVAPPGFVGPMNGLAADLWLPMMMQPAVVPGDRLGARGHGWLQALGRLAPGRSRDEAQAAVDVLAARLARDHPGSNEGRRLAVDPIWSDGAGGLLLPVLGIVMAVVALVLLIACANVSGLLLARASGRQREIAVRLAIGASRGQLVRQLLTESAVLAALGGAAGLLITVWTSRLLTLALPPMPFPVVLAGTINWRVFVFALAVTLVTAVVFGLMPAFAAARASAVPGLKDAAATAASGGQARARIRKSLVVAQVALSLVLLVGAGLFLRTLQHASEIDPGFDLRQGFVARLDAQAGGFDDRSGPVFYQQVLDRIEGLPGVRRATLTTYVPLTVGGGSDMSATIEGYEPAGNERITIYYAMIAPGYFDTLGVSIVEGRGIEPGDSADAPLAVVINETMAKRYWKDGAAIGKRLDFGGGGWATVVGIARDGKYNGINEPPRNFMYIPVYQFYRPDVALIVRSAGDAVTAIPDAQRAMRELNSTLPLFDLMTMEEHLRMSVFIPRLAAWLLGLFGTLALALATLGLYGVVAYVASARTQEIGVRMALGADRRTILQLILREGVGLTAVGLAVGLGLAFAVTPLIASQLVGVSSTDATTLTVTAGILLAAATAAAYIPARRAARMDPLQALRHE